LVKRVGVATRGLTSTFVLLKIRIRVRSRERESIIIFKGEVMQNWTDLLLNSEGINRIFTEGAPLLDDVEVCDIILDSQGPVFRVRFDIAQLPETPPLKWVQQACNRVQIQLVFTGVLAVNISRWSHKSRMALKLFKEDVNVRIIGESQDVSFDVCAEFVSLDKISAYCSTAEWPLELAITKCL